MQAGFALCEAGLTRAKNTGNILMKNMMDFCIGTPCFWLIGFGLMFAGTGPLIGGFDPLIRGSYTAANSVVPQNMPLWCYVIFETVFCATAATIVSGSMAERTNFKAYCVYSAMISLIIYPIEGHWVWGGGWLSAMGFHDFAGSAAVHMTGGLIACLGAWMLGVIGIATYTLITMFIVFKIIDKTIGLRVPAKIEIDGLDVHEHGLTSAYSGFSITDVTDMTVEANENTDLGENEYEKASDAQKNAAIKVTEVSETTTAAAEPGVVTPYITDMHKVSIICRLSSFDALKRALNSLGVTGMTVTQVMGSGLQRGSQEKYRGVTVDSTLIPKIKVEVIVSKIPVDHVIETAKKTLYTGHIGDGKIFVYNVMRAVKVRTGEEGYEAIQDVE